MVVLKVKKWRPGLAGCVLRVPGETGLSAQTYRERTFSGSARRRRADLRAWVRGLAAA